MTNLVTNKTVKIKPTKINYYYQVSTNQLANFNIHSLNTVYLIAVGTNKYRCPVAIATTTSKHIPAPLVSCRCGLSGAAQTYAPRRTSEWR